MGEVYRPEDIVGGKKRPTDLSPDLGEVTRVTLQEIMREIKLLREEIKKIKRVLRANGLVID